MGDGFAPWWDATPLTARETVLGYGVAVLLAARFGLGRSTGSTRR
ncbi:hypothetical protein ACFWP5_24405 [Streptomyces sp. NPDC058469]